MNMYIIALALSISAADCVAQPVQIDSDLISPTLPPVEFVVLDPMLVIQRPGYGVSGAHNRMGFGHSVAIRGDHVIVSAPERDVVTPGGGVLSLRGDVLTYDLRSGRFVGHLEPSISQMWQGFGRNLGATEGFIWVASGQPRIVDLYDGSTGDLARTLTPVPEIDGGVMCSDGASGQICATYITDYFGDPPNGMSVLFDLTTGEELARFECSTLHIDTTTSIVAMDDEHIAVRNTSYQEGGRVDVYNAATFEHEYSIVPDEVTHGFGISIAMNDLYIAAAKMRVEQVDLFEPGGVELYSRETGELVQQFRGSQNHSFRVKSMVMNDRYIAVGFAFNNLVYIFDIEKPERVYLLANGYEFGSSLAMNEDTLVVGDPQQDTVYVYNIGCLADLNDDGVYSTSDLIEYLLLFMDSDLEADLNGDGVLDFFDFSHYLRLYHDGCF